MNRTAEYVGDRGTSHRGRAVTEEFGRLADPYRPELLAYCYRMLGSIHDAEDQVQETYLRAWRSYGAFEGRASLRTWLYRIATNVCLTALKNQGRRPLPSGLDRPSGGTPAGTGRPQTEVPWLEPIPDALLEPVSADPAAVVADRSTLRLALVAALQHLPERQRAALILRDVLGMRAREVADLMGTTVPAVKSMLQRARAQIEDLAPEESEVSEPADPGRRALVDQYMAAFENSDVDGLMRLLTEEAIVEMPPYAAWFRGTEELRAFFTERLTDPDVYRLLRTGANGQPAFGSYRRGEDGVHHAHAVHVLTLGSKGIERLIAFRDPKLFAAFGLPPTYPYR